jgi:anion-transporting  ArsA/GET3 family ATPase
MIKQGPDTFSFKEVLRGRTFGDEMMTFIKENPPETLNASVRKLLKTMQSLRSSQYGETFINILNALREDRSAENANQLFKESLEPIFLRMVPQHNRGNQWDNFFQLCEVAGVNAIDLYYRVHPPKLTPKEKEKLKKKKQK